MPECASHFQPQCPECLKEEEYLSHNTSNQQWHNTPSSSVVAAKHHKHHHHQKSSHHRRSRSHYVGSIISPPSDFLPAQTRQGEIVYVPAHYATQLAACQRSFHTPHTPAPMIGPSHATLGPHMYIAKAPSRGCGADVMGFIAPKIVTVSEAIASPFLALRDAAIKALEQSHQPPVLTPVPLPPPPPVPSSMCPCLQMHYAAHQQQRTFPMLY